MMGEDKISAIDLVKVISAGLVLLSHVGILWTYSGVMDMWVINIAFRWCIPFFFICNGFFMPRGRYKDWFVRMLVMYLIWTGFYAIYGKQVINIMFVKQVAFNGIIPAFWYFPSMIMSMTLCYVLNKAIPSFWICILTVIMYIVGLFGDSYSNINPIAALLQETVLKYHYNIFDYTTRDGILFGGFYISLGNFFNDHKNMISKVGDYARYKVKMGILIAICFIFEALEIYIVRSYNLGIDINVLISTIPLAALIFVFAYNIKIDKKMAIVLRKFSTLIWLIHPFVISLLQDKIENSVSRFLGVLFVTVTIASVLIKLSSKISVLSKIY